MPDNGHHCPFLNRADARCAEKFSIEHLDYAYRFCFDKYQTCPVYLELLVERKVKRVNGSVVRNADSRGPLVQVKVAQRKSSSGFRTS